MLFRIINYLGILTLVIFMIGCTSDAPEQKQTNQEQLQTQKLKQATTPPKEQPHIEGIITKLETNKLLVEENPDEPEVTEKAAVNFQEETRYWRKQGNQYNPGKQAELKKGMKVTVWYTGIAVDSYPVQANGGHIVYEK